MNDFKTESVAIAATEMIRTLVAVLRINKIVAAPLLRDAILATQGRLGKSEDPDSQDGARFLAELFQGDPVMKKTK